MSITISRFKDHQDVLIVTPDMAAVIWILRCFGYKVLSKFATYLILRLYMKRNDTDKLPDVKVLRRIKWPMSFTFSEIDLKEKYF